MTGFGWAALVLLAVGVVVSAVGIPWVMRAEDRNLREMEAKRQQFREAALVKATEFIRVHGKPLSDNRYESNLEVNVPVLFYEFDGHPVQVSVPHRRGYSFQVDEAVANMIMEVLASDDSAGE